MDLMEKPVVFGHQPLVIQDIKPSELVLAAIHHLKDAKGSTAKEIVDYLSNEYDCDGKQLKKSVQVALKRGVNYGMFQKDRNGGYRLEPICDNNIMMGKRSCGRGRRGRSRSRRGRGRRSRSRRGGKKRSKSRRGKCGKSKSRRGGRKRSRSRRGRGKRSRSKGCGKKGGRRGRSRRRRSRSRKSKGGGCGKCKGKKPRRCDLDEDD